MPSSNFDEATLGGDNKMYAAQVAELMTRFGFDFVALGLTAFVGAPLRWIYSAGATGERYRRIVLAPGHGIGGIVLKAGKPMLYTDIDTEMDPRSYSSYPIVFAEDLHSFCALPLSKGKAVVGVLLAAFRTSNPQHIESYHALIDALNGQLCGLHVTDEDFLSFEQLAAAEQAVEHDAFIGYSALSKMVNAQEEERRRISRELHDGTAQELLAVTFLLQRLRDAETQEEAHTLLDDVDNAIAGVLDELHNISVELRPSTLDHFGLVSALRSQAVIYEGTYGARIDFEVEGEVQRLDQAHETQTYRICQEAILNACKYSGADVVHVHLAFADGWLRAVIADEGDGFDVKHPVIRGSGCGLSGMQERAGIIGATLTVESGANGTTVTLVSPISVLAQKAGGR